MLIHPLLVLATSVLRLFPLTQLANLRHFLIYTLSYSVERPLDGCVPLRLPPVSDGNIIFDLCPHVKERKQGVKQGLGVIPCLTSFVLSLSNLRQINSSHYGEDNTECPTRYRTRHFFSNFTTNEDIATKYEADLPHCVRKVTTS